MVFCHLHHAPAMYFVKLCALHAENDAFELYSDDVIVTGVLTAKWSSDLKDVRCDLDPVLIANHVR